MKKILLTTHKNLPLMDIVDEINERGYIERHDGRIITRSKNRYFIDSDNVFLGIEISILELLEFEFLVKEYVPWVRIFDREEDVYVLCKVSSGLQTVYRDYHQHSQQLITIHGIRESVNGVTPICELTPKGICYEED